MKNLIIVGNGFDLAHGLRTNYFNFIDHLIYEINFHSGYQLYRDIENGKKQLQKEGKYFTAFLVQTYATRDVLWKDIEYAYFECLSLFPKLGPILLREQYKLSSDRLDISNDVKDSKSADAFENVIKKHKTLESFQNEFEWLKNELIEYLKGEEQKFECSNSYSQLFDIFGKNNTVILNFNYTSTVSKYIEQIKDKDIQSRFEEIKIHGDLYDSTNPAIFGFAANNEDSKAMLANNNNEYVRNIKKFNYLYTGNKSRLNELVGLSKNPSIEGEFDIYILGHSIGISDSLILSEVLNSPHVRSIHAVHYNGHKSYFDTMVNIDRIVDDYSKSSDENDNFHKLEFFDEHLKMPQKDDKGLSRELCHKLYELQGVSVPKGASQRPGRICLSESTV